MVGISKNMVYQIAKFAVLSFIIVYILYLQMDMPITLVLVLEILLLIKVLPVTKFVEKAFVKVYPKYVGLSIWAKRLLLFAFFILLYVILKFLIVNVIMIEILNIPVEEQINEFINRYANEA